MTQGERVKKIRKSLNLTLEKFGERLGVGKTAISKIEKGENKLTAQMTKMICSEYGVNFDYLNSGNGEMFAGMPEDAVDALCHEFNLDSLDRVIIQEYLRLDTHSRDVLKAYMRNIRERVKKDAVQAQIDAEVEAYRADLEEEKNHKDGSSASDTQLDA